METTQYFGGHSAQAELYSQLQMHQNYCIAEGLLKKSLFAKTPSRAPPGAEGLVHTLQWHILSILPKITAAVTVTGVTAWPGIFWSFPVKEK